MSASVITLAFENWKAQEAASGKPVLLNEFVFANVPNMDVNKPIDRNEKIPPANQIVHRQAVNKAGLASENAVAYSVTLGAEVGNFDFNWIGLINKESGVIAMITHAPTQKKLKTQSGQQGNVLTRSFLLEFNGAALETQINTRAETWQIDFTARLSGIDEMQRLVNLDTYGAASFMGNGFQVTRSAEQFTVRSGAGYIGGLRGELEQNQILNSLRNTKVFADFSYQGNITSQWRTVVKITSATTLTNYVDAAGFAHYVFAVANIDAAGGVTDLRPKGSLIEQQANNDFVTKKTKINGKQLTEDVTITSQDIFNSQATPIPDNADLNTYTVPGLYFQPISAQAVRGKNYPIDVAGSLEIHKNAGVTQVYRVYIGSLCFVRSMYAGAWSAWSFVYDSNNKPTAEELDVVSRAGGRMSGTLNQDSVPSEKYLQTALSDAERGSKNYLRKMRGGRSDHLWHETVRAGEYRLSVGDTDVKDILSLSVDDSAKFNGEVISTKASGLRIVNKGVGTFFRNDGENFYLMMTNQGDEFGGFNSLRPMRVSINTGEMLVAKLKLADYSYFDERYLRREEVYPVGAPIPWPQSSVPSGFLLCNGQSFNKATYPLLASAYPSGLLPDLRGEFIRGLDAYRGVDSGRAVLSAQGDAIRNITGSFQPYANAYTNGAAGAFRRSGSTYGGVGNQLFENSQVVFDASTVVPTASENRPRNIAFSYIVRAA